MPDHVREIARFGPRMSLSNSHLVNFADFPVETVTVYLTGQFQQAVLLTPEGEQKLEVYKTEEGSGVDIDKITSVATLRVE